MQETSLVIMLVYVDDLLITGNDHLLILDTKKILKDTFKIKDLGELRYFLGIEFPRNKDGIIMHQRKYCLELISDMGLSGSKPTGTPVELNQRLTSAEFDLHFPSQSKTDRLLKIPLSIRNCKGDFST